MEKRNLRLRREDPENLLRELYIRERLWGTLQVGSHADRANDAVLLLSSLARVAPETRVKVFKLIKGTFFSEGFLPHVNQAAGLIKRGQGGMALLKHHGMVAGPEAQLTARSECWVPASRATHWMLPGEFPSELQADQVVQSFSFFGARVRAVFSKGLLPNQTIDKPLPGARGSVEIAGKVVEVTVLDPGLLDDYMSEDPIMSLPADIRYGMQAALGADASLLLLQYVRSNGSMAYVLRSFVEFEDALADDAQAS